MFLSLCVVYFILLKLFVLGMSNKEVNEILMAIRILCIPDHQGIFAISEKV